VLQVKSDDHVLHARQVDVFIGLSIASLGERGSLLSLQATSPSDPVACEQALFKASSVLSDTCTSSSMNTDRHCFASVGCAPCASGSAGAAS
jgi:hypothetical protein